MLGQPVQALVSQAFLETTARNVLTAWLESPTALAQLNVFVEWLTQQLQADRSRLETVTPAELRSTLRALFGRPFSPDRKLVLTIIDRAPTRALVRQLLLDAILQFGRKASAPMAGMARGFGSFAKFAGDTVKARSGGLGSLVGAVTDEVERQLEKRATDFVDSALASIFGQIADSISDPTRADEAAEIRLAIFDGVLELTFPQLARELMNLDVPGGATLVRDGLRRWLATPASGATLQALSGKLLERQGHRTPQQLLSELGLLEVTHAVLSERLAFVISTVAKSPAFETWLQNALSQD